MSKRCSSVTLTSSAVQALKTVDQLVSLAAGVGAVEIGERAGTVAVRPASEEESSGRKKDPCKRGTQLSGQCG